MCRIPFAASTFQEAVGADSQHYLGSGFRFSMSLCSGVGFRVWVALGIPCYTSTLTNRFARNAKRMPIWFRAGWGRWGSGYPAGSGYVYLWSWDACNFRSGSGLSSSTGRSNWARLLGAWGAEGEFLPSLHVLIKRGEIPLPSDNIMSLQGLQAFKNQGWQGVGLKLCRQDGWL